MDLKKISTKVFRSSAPTTTAANRGIEGRQVKVGCVMAGESQAIGHDGLPSFQFPVTFDYAFISSNRLGPTVIYHNFNSSCGSTKHSSFKVVVWNTLWSISFSSSCGSD